MGAGVPSGKLSTWSLCFSLTNTKTAGHLFCKNNPISCSAWSKTKQSKMNSRFGDQAMDLLCYVLFFLLNNERMGSPGFAEVSTTQRSCFSKARLEATAKPAEIFSLPKGPLSIQPNGHRGRKRVEAASKSSPFAITLALWLTSPMAWSKLFNNDSWFGLPEIPFVVGKVEID